MPIPERTNLEKEEVLQVLREIKNDPVATQRDLSVRLGISLGKINFIMKALIQRGLVKAHNFKNSSNKSAYLYYLTPNGFEEKARITYCFLKRKVKEYEDLELEIQQLKREVSEAADKTGDGAPVISSMGQRPFFGRGEKEASAKQDV